jgi:MFS family permease
MYQLDWIQRLQTRSTTSAAVGPRRKWGLDVSSNVWSLGFTSLFTDISSEMVSSILPIYFVSYLQFNPLRFGILDGIYQGAAVALLSLAAGILADRWRRQKEIAVAGYGFSAFSKLILLLVGGNWMLAAVTLGLDRVGKGVRTAPRDAIISLSSKRESLATAFAVHRGLDAGGAVLGPLVAFFLLRMVPGGFPLVIMASFCLALMGLGLISLLVEKPVAAPAGREISWQRSLALWNHRPFRVLLISGGLLSLVTVSDGFLYLSLQKRTGVPVTTLPLFAFLTAGIYLLLSVPMGRIADRWGREKIFLTGNALLIIIYLLLAMPGLGNRAAFAAIGFLGAYYASTDGVMAAMSSAVLKPELRASGLAILNTIVSIFRFFSSFLFGLLSVTGSANLAIIVFLAGMAMALVAVRWLLSGRERT